jgi:hypothetical protein
VSFPEALSHQKTVLTRHFLCSRCVGNCFIARGTVWSIRIRTHRHCGLAVAGPTVERSDDQDVDLERMPGPLEGEAVMYQLVPNN